MADKDNDPQAEDFEPKSGSYLQDMLDEEHDFELWEKNPYVNPDLVEDFDTPEVISLDLEYPDEVAVVKYALSQIQVLSNIVLGADARRILARIDNELAG